MEDFMGKRYYRLAGPTGMTQLLECKSCEEEDFHEENSDSGEYLYICASCGEQHTSETQLGVHG